MSDSEAVAALRSNPKLDAGIVGVLATLKALSCETAPRAVHIRDLAAGMVLQEEIRTKTGQLLVGKDQELTYPHVVWLSNYHARRAIADKVLVLVPCAQL